MCHAAKLSADANDNRMERRQPSFSVLMTFIMHLRYDRKRTEEKKCARFLIHKEPLRPPSSCYLQSHQDSLCGVSVSMQPALLHSIHLQQMVSLLGSHEHQTLNALRAC
eukprot:24903-Eustigmatos_ZCMA.PRE.1